MFKPKYFSSYIILLLITSFQFFTGCVTVPTHLIWRPWTRTFESDTTLPLYANLHVDVKGNTLALIGDEKLFQNDLRETVTNLLERRGFRVSNGTADYNLSLNYKTVRNDKINSYSESSANSKNTSIGYSGYGSNSALGVLVAGAILGIANQSTATLQNSTETVESYTHIISMEVYRRDNSLVWEGESAWDSYNLDLSTDINPALQILMSWLPNDNTTIPRVPEVKESKKDNYYNLNCKAKFFSCPALPYRIAFNYYLALIRDKNVESPDYVVDPRAYDAFLDLLQSAEYALPLGADDYSFPLEKGLWTEVEIGGKYYIGKDKQPTNILIRLEGEESGYKIVKCWVAGKDEYGAFESRLFQWRSALNDYYNLRQ
jgi:hypothetical protein